MAFSNYSTLFKCGLLSEGSSPSYASEPWATEYYGPRRGSLQSTLDDLSTPPGPSSLSVYEASESVASGESFYFTFKKKRNSAEQRSFLSLDLAESQSLRAASVKGKDSVNILIHTLHREETTAFSPAAISSFMNIYSPPPPFSPPRSPLSAHSAPDPELPTCFGVPRLPETLHQPKSFVQEPLPLVLDCAFPSRSPHPKRDLSPMRFSAPSPPPLPPVRSHFDSFSERSVKSSDVLSRSSTVSSSYRRAQRIDALKHLEGRAADGAVGRIKPRLSQNFMSMSDDEDEGMPLHADVNVIVEDTAAESEAGNGISRAGRSSRSRGSTVSIDGKAWYNLTPRASAWGVLFGGEGDGDIASEVDKIFGLDASPSPISHGSNDSNGSRKSKRSKRSNSHRSSHQQSTIPLPTRASTQPQAHLHPLYPTASTSPSSSSPSLMLRPNPPSKSTTRSLSASNPRGVRTRTVSDYGNRNPHLLDMRAQTRPSRLQSRLPTRLELHLDWASSTPEAPSFIDMRDESLETDSRSDSWRSLFEVPCAA